MRNDTRREFGISGEGLAYGWLTAHGWQILERNWRCRWGEIDLIADDHGTRVFVEVKARQSGMFGSGAEAVHRKKQLRIRRAASAYMQNRPEGPCRFDVISIAWRNSTPQLTHTRDAYS
jgi:putative endonuclease